MEDLTGKQFGHYQIVGPLGEGGMAAVFKAYQPTMERYVAIKVLPRHLAVSQEFVARFQQEAKLLAKLQHPHILPVFDYGESDGYTYIVMPFIQGGTLSDLIEKRHFSFSEAREIISQIGSALGYAHSHGMIHRDVKPSNVLIDETGNCLLTDFGLARMIESTSNLTTSGAIVGTPAYMSPEQGAGKKIDNRSDIYSLGIILFELLSGRVPYTAETPVAIVFKHLQDPLPSIKKYNQNISTEVEMILYKAMAKNPEDRYQSAEDFIHALEQADISDKVPAPISEVKIPNDAERLAAEKAAAEEAEHLATEKAAQEQAQRLAAEKLAHEQNEREAARVAALEQARRLSAEKAAKELANRESSIRPALRQSIAPKDKKLDWLFVLIAVAMGGVLVISGLAGLLWLRSVTKAPVKLVLAGQTPGFSFGTDLPFVLKIAFSPDGSQLVSSSINYDIQLWSVKNGSLLNSYGWGNEFALSKDGDVIATSDLSLYHLSDGSSLETHFDKPADSASFDLLDFSPDGRILASAKSAVGTGEILLWDVTSGALRKTLKATDQPVTCLAFSPNGQLLAAGYDDTLIRIWRVVDGQMLTVLKGDEYGVYSIAFSPDGQRLASSHISGIRIWRVSDGNLLNQFSFDSGSSGPLAFSPDGVNLALGGLNGDILVFSSDDGSVLHQYKPASWPISDVAFSPDGKLLASADRATIRLWDVSK